MSLLHIYIQSSFNHTEPTTTLHKNNIPEYSDWNIVYSIIQIYAKKPYIITPSADNQSITISYIQNPKHLGSYEDIHGLNYII
jgi:hypothetical protein